MTGISTNSKKFNMYPGMRPLQGEYKKTIMIVTGKALEGKSTLCSFLLNDNTNYISVDAACECAGHNIKEMLDFVEELRIGINKNPILSDKCCSEFMDYFFDKYVKNNENLNILIDGYLFTLENVLACFLEKCKFFGYRVWTMVRIL